MLNSQNILIDKNKKGYLADFSLTRPMEMMNVGSNKFTKVAAYSSRLGESVLAVVYTGCGLTGRCATGAVGTPGSATLD